MDRFRRILLVARPDAAMDAAARRALDLARANEASIDIVHVEPEATGTGALQRLLFRATGRTDAYEALAAERGERLEALAGAFADASVPVSVERRRGRPFLEITRAAMRGRSDLILKETRPSPERLDATDLHLMRKAPCPVWLMRPDALRFGQILCAVDPDPADPPRMALAHSVLKLATSLAERERCALTVVHCWRVDGESALRDSSFVRLEPAEIAAISDAARDEATERLAALLVRHDVESVGAEVLIRQCEPAAGIVLAAEEVSADLIVMGTVGRSGIAGLLIGNTAETVLGRVDCSVLAAKPEGFLSPVSPEAETEAETLEHRRDARTEAL